MMMTNTKKTNTKKLVKMLKTNELMKYFLTVSIAFFIMTASLDFIVTYTVYKNNNDRFVFGEVNKEIVDYHMNGVFPINNILGNSLAFIPIIFYYLELKYKRDIWIKMFVIFILLTVAMGYGHLEGAMSWLR